MNATAKAFAISAVACGMHIGVPAAPAPENTPDCYVEWVQAKGDLYIDTGIIGRVGTKSEIYFGNIKSTWADVMLGSFIVDNGDEKRIHLCGFFYEEVYLQYGSKYKEGAAKYGSVPVGGDYLTETEFAADGTLTGRTVNANGTSETATVLWRFQARRSPALKARRCALLLRTADTLALEKENTLTISPT